MLTIISSITLRRLYYLIQIRVKNKTGVCIASTPNVTENLPATELENRETREDLSTQDFVITENDPNHSAETSLKGAKCINKSPPVHNEVEQRKKSYASDGSHSATVMKKTFINAASNYEEIDLTPCDVSVQKETQMQKGSEKWDPSHIYSAVNKKSPKTAGKCNAENAEKEGMCDNCLYAVVNKKKQKIPPRSFDYGELEALEVNEMYSNSKGGEPQLILRDTRDPSYSVIDKKIKQVTDYIPELEEQAPEIPSFDLSMMYSVD